MKNIAKFVFALASIASLSACIAVSDSGSIDTDKRVAQMAQQALATCGQGNVEKVSASSFSCKVTK
jgi:hypothetical protein